MTIMVILGELLFMWTGVFFPSPFISWYGLFYGAIMLARLIYLMVRHQTRSKETIKNLPQMDHGDWISQRPQKEKRPIQEEIIRQDRDIV